MAEEEQRDMTLNIKGLSYQVIFVSDFTASTLKEASTLRGLGPLKKTAAFCQPKLKCLEKGKCGGESG